MKTDLDEVIKALSIEEKARILVGIGDTSKSTVARVPGAAGQTHPVARLGIPGYVFADGPAGVRIEGEGRKATAFPVEIMLASTWNPEIVELVGRAMGEEARVLGVDLLLAPALNIHRHPLGGRSFEYFSEDPVLSGVMAAAYVRGVQSAGVGACLKHFACNEQETGRWGLDTFVSERALREIYLRAFEIAVKEGKPWAVMSAYNKLNGFHCSENRWLLTRVLREEWGFDGFVVSDWGAGESVARMLEAGNDVIMPGGEEKVEELVNSVQKGLVSEETINASVRRVLSVLSWSKASREPGTLDPRVLEEHGRIAYEAAAEGVVLLKNDGALPLSKDKRLAFFGFGQLLAVKGGMGSGHTHPARVWTVLEAAVEKGLKVDTELAEVYRQKFSELSKEDLERFFYDEPDKPQVEEGFLGREVIESVAERSDAAVIFITRVSGEGWDLSPEDFYLSDGESKLIDEVSRSFHGRGKKVVAVLNVGAPVDAWSWKDKVDAILLVWQPGQEAGIVVVDALIGEINPSGKLPVTFPKRLEDVPSWSFPGEPPENPRRVVYEEDIYVGYRFYDTFGVEPAYEFGYGLSYTSFLFSDLRLSLEGDWLDVSFKVSNNGNFPGKEVAQVYVKAPKGRLDKPFKELKAFKKTRTLRPGEEEQINLRILLRSLASFDGEKWVLDRGVYKVLVGSSSRRINLQGEVEISQEKNYRP